MDDTTTTSVLVAGAGPVGLALAVRLAAAGVPHLVIERAAAPATTSRAAVVHARTLEVLDALDVADALVARGVVVPHFAVRDRDRTLLRVDFTGLPTRYPYTLMVPQDVTEQVLTETLEARGGAVRHGHTLTGYDVDGDGRVVARVDGPDGRLTVRADHLVGADGMHSHVRALAGIDFTGAAYAQSFVLADVVLEADLPTDEVQLFFSPHGLVVVAPLPLGRRRIVATVDTAPEHPGPEEIASLLADRGPRSGVRVRELVWSSRFRVHHRLARHYRRGPVLLAGDAAHVHSPAGGQGMNTGIQDAVDLGARLAAVHDGEDPALLDGYERDRRPVARQVVAVTDRMTRAATLSGVPARMRNVVLRGLDGLPPARRAAAMNLSELATPLPFGSDGTAVAVGSP
ncbi:FAD-dependent monooxygenase [Actinomycetospora sp. TBRC 11914]|uniref:FAD-dependent monooxygenase n=1 Tax=Actinomycetospora sp. TBRC 11914 TaxID=2729387 RepID=UPI00145D3DB4|nr:FAD-dependent monooxygenase [Actinomycetospora sp. TBRC 11914]NMO91556.1 pentachlorophenol monooxygenase [Actinomycetospora sp. TBRC 11914]